MQPGGIIIAEDDDNLRKMYAIALEAAGHKVRTAQNGQQALRLLEEAPAQLLVLDVMMPVMDGVEACTIARTAHRFTAPILFLSALDNQATVERCKAAGGDDFIPKSGNIRQFVDHISQWVCNANHTRNKAEDRGGEQRQ